MRFRAAAVCLTLGLVAAQDLQRIEAEAEEATHWHEREVPNDPRHKVYYWNDQTRQTSWELPKVQSMGAQVPWGVRENTEAVDQEKKEDDEEEEADSSSPQIAQWRLSAAVAKDYFKPSGKTPPTPPPAEEASLISKHLDMKKSFLKEFSKLQEENQDKNPVKVKFKIKPKARMKPPPPMPKSSWPPPMGSLIPPFLRKKAPKLAAAKPKSRKKASKAQIVGVMYKGHLVGDERGLEEIVRDSPSANSGLEKAAKLGLMP